MSNVVAAAGLILLLGVTVSRVQAAGPDFASCADSGEAFGLCVAGIAQAFQPEDEQTGTSAGVDALVEGCSAFAGEQFGACMAAAAQGAHDRGDPPGAAVSEAAHALVEGCRGQVGRDFGACVSAAAHQLGHGQADRQRDDDESESDDGEPAAHHGKPESPGNHSHGEKPAHGQKTSRPGGH
jgi:hypothetical protein